MTETPGNPPFSGTALAALLLSVSTVSAGYGIVLPILPLMLLAIYGPNAATEVARHTGLLTAVHAMALFLFAPVWGWLSDGQGRRAILVIGLVGFSVSLLLASIKPTIGAFYAERFFTGLFASAITPVASAVITDQRGSDAWRARRLAWVSMASISGFLIGPMLSGFLATLPTVVSFGGAVARQSYELPFLAVSILALAAALAVHIWLPRTIASSADQIQSRPARDKDMRIIWTLRAVGLVVALGIGAFEVGLALRGNQDLGMDPRQVALMFTVCSLVMCLFAYNDAGLDPMVHRPGPHHHGNGAWSRALDDRVFGSPGRCCHRRRERRHSVSDSDVLGVAGRWTKQRCRARKADRREQSWAGVGIIGRRFAVREHDCRWCALLVDVELSGGSRRRMLAIAAASGSRACDFAPGQKPHASSLNLKR
ncbi:MAG: MFS transporter [Hyphomicrobium denitrificans]|nr:MFS transporter [Hyphomicrobium denitrificans]